MSQIPEAAVEAAETFQTRVDAWLIACFGETIARDKAERNHRFIEEALELVQANGCTQSEAHQLVDYVYGRPIGQLHQEVGGVMNTLAALCLANGIDLNDAAETELARVWTKVEKIRAKQAAKPKHSPLPEAAAPLIAPPDAAVERYAIADAINRARYVPGGLPECGVDDEDARTREYAYRLADAAIGVIAARSAAPQPRSGE